MSFQDFAEQTDARLPKKRQRLIAGAATALALALVFILALVGSFPSLTSEPIAITKAEADEMPEEVDEAQAESETEPTRIFVHVAGDVTHPGVYCLDEGARVADAIAAAGGLTNEDAQISLNMARVLADGEQILVGVQTKVAQTGVEITDQNAASTASGRVNINTADADALQTISGIGESKANKIIAYREKNGPFKSVDDLVNVSGIGEKTLDSLRDQICV